MWDGTTRKRKGYENPSILSNGGGVEPPIQTSKFLQLTASLQLNIMILCHGQFHLQIMQIQNCGLTININQLLMQDSMVSSLHSDCTVKLIAIAG